MAKPKTPNGNGKVVTIQPDGRRTRAHVTTSGVTLTLSAFPPLAQAALREALESEWEAEGRTIPARPTYTLTTAAGTTETHEHDEQTLKDNPEAQAAWEAWQSLTRAFELELRARTMRSIILDCLEFAENPNWDKKNKAKRVKVPEDPDERKLFYARTVVLADVQDYVDVMRLTAELAGATEQQLAAVRSAFQHPVEDSGRAAAGDAATEEG